MTNNVLSADLRKHCYKHVEHAGTCTYVQRRSPFNRKEKHAVFHLQYFCILFNEGMSVEHQQQQQKQAPKIWNKMAP